jgi:hypothetical protein
MDKPSPPPEAALLRLVRTAAGIKAADAAAAVARSTGRKFSASRWSQIELGYETRDGTYKSVRAPASTLAHMFRVIGMNDPKRLESAGKRPDAAEVLREILRSEPVPSQPVPRPVVIYEGDGPEAEFVAKILALLGPRDQEVIHDIMRMVDGEGRPWTWERKKQEIETYAGIFGQRRPAVG